MSADIDPFAFMSDGQLAVLYLETQADIEARAALLGTITAELGRRAAQAASVTERVVAVPEAALSIAAGAEAEPILPPPSTTGRIPRPMRIVGPAHTPEMNRDSGTAEPAIADAPLARPAPAVETDIDIQPTLVHDGGNGVVIINGVERHLRAHRSRSDLWEKRSAVWRVLCEANGTMLEAQDLRAKGITMTGPSAVIKEMAATLLDETDESIIIINHLGPRRSEYGLRPGVQFVSEPAVDAGPAPAEEPNDPPEVIPDEPEASDSVDAGEDLATALHPEPILPENSTPSVLRRGGLVEILNAVEIAEFRIANIGDNGPAQAFTYEAGGRVIVVGDISCEVGDSRIELVNHLLKNLDHPVDALQLWLSGYTLDYIPNPAEGRAGQGKLDEISASIEPIVIRLNKKIPGFILARYKEGRVSELMIDPRFYPVIPQN